MTAQDLHDFLTAVRSLFVPEVLALVIPCMMIIIAVLLAEAHERMENRIAMTRKSGEEFYAGDVRRVTGSNPYLSPETEQARAGLHERAVKAERRGDL